MGVPRNNIIIYIHIYIYMIYSSHFAEYIKYYTIINEDKLKIEINQYTHRRWRIVMDKMGIQRQTNSSGQRINK